MLAAIQFNHELRFMTAEVGDEITYRKLTPEMEAVQSPGAESVPQFRFCISLLAAQSAGALMHEWCCSFALAC
jgi:hypothetical protein